MVTRPARLTLLTVVLRIAGAVLVTAFLAVLLPPSWMAATHERLGMGPYPQGAVVDYLSRSAAALYGFHGVLLLIAARDPVRYREIIGFIAVMNVVFGSMMIAIDLYAGMPWFWTLFEGPPIIGYGILIGVLNRQRE